MVTVALNLLILPIVFVLCCVTKGQSTDALVSSKITYYYALEVTCAFLNGDNPFVNSGYSVFAIGNGVDLSEINHSISLQEF